MRHSSEELLEPSRIATLEKIMSLYGKHLQENDKLKVGVDGDPCSSYRSSADAPSAIVTQILHRQDGFLRFRARMSGSGQEVELNNRSFDPDSVWEVHPEFVDEFAERVQQYRGNRTGDEIHSSMLDRVGNLERELRSVRSEIFERVDSISESLDRVKGGEFRGVELDTVEELKQTDKAFRETIASTIRALAGDTLRLARGEPVEFAHQYVDRYDLALEDRAFSASFRGGSRSKANKFEKERTTFDVETYRKGHAASVEEDSTLTD